MLHQTLTISSFSTPSPCLSSSLPLRPLWSSLAPDVGMEAPKTSLLLQQQPQQQGSHGVLDEDVAWAVGNGNFWGEEFSVDDLLNLEFIENEKGAEEEGEEAKHKGTEDSNSGSPSPSSSSSSLSFQPLSEISLPAHDAEELEWVSLIIDDSLPEFSSCPGVVPLPLAPRSPDETETQAESRRAHTTEGDSSVSPTVCVLSTEAVVPVRAKRSKRSRTAAGCWSVSRSLPFAESSSDSITTTTSSSASSFSSPALSFHRVTDHLSAAGERSILLCGSLPPDKQQKPNKRGRKPKSPPSAAASNERRCTHCGAQKTPQWRAGPLGPKTLCNACGVRFKSGRLLPEYRPACSPTFVSHVHSNCHRKVLEMRRKKQAAAAPPVTAFSTRFTGPAEPVDLYVM
ncbi:GATA transcription factor [Musa troglodytarum]|uniref:GATA transcription factor n=1 Tax=Musa troglodytarum TaxID=320322 RepID=A0A9E7K2H1_9LILI|nr:GATA transcription factor [Musa troglodytarum]